MPQLIGKDLIKKQNERIASEIVSDLSILIDNKNMEKEFVAREISETLGKISRKDEEFAKLILKLLKERYDTYDFEIK